MNTDAEPSQTVETVHADPVPSVAKSAAAGKVRSPTQPLADSNFIGINRARLTGKLPRLKPEDYPAQGADPAP